MFNYPVALTATHLHNFASVRCTIDRFRQQFSKHLSTIMAEYNNENKLIKIHSFNNFTLLHLLHDVSEFNKSYGRVQFLRHLRHRSVGFLSLSLLRSEHVTKT
jgi:hypothetical protein